MFNELPCEYCTRSKRERRAWRKVAWAAAKYAKRLATVEEPPATLFNELPCEYCTRSKRERRAWRKAAWAAAKYAKRLATVEEPPANARTVVL